MKKILGVIGSPRKKGNTQVLVSRILEGSEAQGANIESIFLKDFTIEECDGCHACWKGKTCSKNDDMVNIYEKIIENDVIIFGTPVYWYGPTALMKCFIDRFVYFNCGANRKKIRGKNAVIVVPFEDKTLETSDLIVTFFERSFEYLEIKLTEKLLVPGVTKLGEVKGKTAVMHKCFELGKNIVLGDKD